MEKGKGLHIKTGILVLIILSQYCWGTEVAKPEPPQIGLFSLPSSQQPGPFRSFGQNIIDKNQIQIFGEVNYLHYSSINYSWDAIPTFTYGLNDTSSIFLSVPYSLRNVSKSNHSSGIGDGILQGEYAFYSDSNATFYTTATMVGNVTLPTGSYHKNPQTGLGSPSFFGGVTYNQMWVDWY